MGGNKYFAHLELRGPQGAGQFDVFDHKHDRVFTVSGNEHPRFVMVRQYLEDDEGHREPEKWQWMPAEHGAILDYLVEESKKPARRGGGV